MKAILFSLFLVMLTACSSQAAYDMIHGYERQKCLQQGRTDCPQVEPYGKYKNKRDKIVKPAE